MGQLATDELIAQIDQIGRSADFQSQADRVRIRESLYAALARVSTPLELATDHCFKNPSELAGIETLINVNLFPRWIEAGGQASTTMELAKLTNMDPALLRRLLQMLAASYMLQNTGEDTFELTEYARALSDDGLAAIYTYGAEACAPCLANLPKFLESTKYRNPTDLYDSNWQHWRGPQETCFSYFTNNPTIGKAFNETMTIYSNSKLPWCDLYPVASIPTKSRLGKPLVVDVGGGVGHDLEKLRDRCPGKFPDGSLIVQDLPDVIRMADHNGQPISAVGHDFFQPQPDACAGAYIYLLHVVLHDWPDVEALVILRNLACVMERGYSRLLVYESVMTGYRPDRRVCFFDMCMMAMLSAGERSDTRWQGLFEQAGLRITRTFTSIEAPETLMEVELI